MHAGNDTTSRTSRTLRSPLVQAGVLLLLAVATRIYRLTHWPLAGDEFFTIADSQALAFKWKPLLFYLNHYLVDPLLGLDVLGARFLPALSGIVSILLLYWAGRKLWGDAAGFFAALLAVFNPWHLYLSQFARYYTLVFLFSVVVIVAFYLAYRDDSPGWLAAGVVAGVLAMLSHASAGLVVGAIGAWVVAATAWRFVTGGRVSRFRMAVSGVVVAVLLAATAVYFVPMLIDWQSIPASYGFAGPVLFLSFGQWLTAGTSLFAVGGAWWMWRGGDRSTMTYLVSVAALPFFFLAVAGYFIKAAVPFLFPAAPAVFLLAGCFLDRLYGALDRRASVPAAAVAVVLLAGVATGAPSFVSHYMDGSRPDFRGAANFLNETVGPGDLVLTDLKNALERHLDAGPTVRGFDRSVEQLEEAARVDGEGAGSDVWITPWFKERGGFSDRGLGDATGWVRENCTLEHVVSRPRLDFRRNAVPVYRCGRQGSDRTPAGPSADGPRIDGVGPGTPSFFLPTTVAAMHQ